VTWLEDGPALEILECFAITATMEEPGSGAGPLLDLGIRPSRHFGPLVELERAGHPPVLRITPLTDRDIAETVEFLGYPADTGLEELLGRVSQMIEELPWLAALHARVFPGREGQPRLVRPRLGLRPVVGPRPGSRPD